MIYIIYNNIYNDIYKITKYNIYNIKIYNI